MVVEIVSVVPYNIDWQRGSVKSPSGLLCNFCAPYNWCLLCSIRYSLAMPHRGGDKQCTIRLFPAEVDGGRGSAYAPK